MASTPIPLNVNANNPSSILNAVLQSPLGTNAHLSSQTSSTRPDQDALEMELDAARTANTNYIDTLNMAREMVNAKNYKALVMNNIAMGNDPLNSSLTRQVESYANNRTGTTSPEEGLFGPNVMTVAPEREAPMFDPSKMVMPKVPQITDSQQNSVGASTHAPAARNTTPPPINYSFLGLPGFGGTGGLMPLAGNGHDTPSTNAIRTVGIDPNQIANYAPQVLDKNNISPDKTLQTSYMGAKTNSFADLYALAWMKAIKNHMVANGLKSTTQDMLAYAPDQSIKVAPGIYIKPHQIAKGNLDSGLYYKPNEMYTPKKNAQGGTDWELDAQSTSFIDAALNNSSDANTNKTLAGDMKKVVQNGWKNAGTDPNGKQRKFDWIGSPEAQAQDILRAGMLYGILSNDLNSTRTGAFRSSSNAAKHEKYWDTVYGK